LRTILVCGGAGFIGSNFVKFITTKNPDVTCIVLDKLTYAGNIANLKNEIASGKIHFVRGSITDTACVQGIFDKYTPEVVVNFAAESHVDRSIVGPQVFVETNVIGTQTLLSVASWGRKGCSQKKHPLVPGARTPLPRPPPTSSSTVTITPTASRQ
jgi:dTDP-glucose 4,6-dehydratase